MPTSSKLMMMTMIVTSNCIGSPVPSHCTICFSVLLHIIHCVSPRLLPSPDTHNKLSFSSWIYSVVFHFVLSHAVSCAQHATFFYPTTSSCKNLIHPYLQSKQAFFMNTSWLVFNWILLWDESVEYSCQERSLDPLSISSTLCFATSYLHVGQATLPLFVRFFINKMRIINSIFWKNKMRSYLQIS